MVGNSKGAKKTVAFRWMSIIIGNLKTTLAETFHKLSNKHLPRHLATFQYRFNQKYRLKDMIAQRTLKHKTPIQALASFLCQPNLMGPES